MVMMLLRKTVTTADMNKALVRMPGTVMRAFLFYSMLSSNPFISQMWKQAQSN